MSNVTESISKVFRWLLYILFTWCRKMHCSGILSRKNYRLFCLSRSYLDLCAESYFMPEMCLHMSLLPMKHNAFSCIIACVWMYRTCDSFEAIIVMELSGNMSTRSIYWHSCTYFFYEIRHINVQGEDCACTSLCFSPN